MAAAPPLIFSPARRMAIRQRMAVRQHPADAARYLFADIAEDTAERLGFLRHQPPRTLLLADAGNTLGAALASLGNVAMAPAFALEEPWPLAGFDLIVAPLAFDTANDLPGALVHARRALNPGGLLLVTMLGAGSLPALRQIMLAADGERPAPRLHPQVDVRAGAQLLQRAGLADPVADSRSLTVRFSSLNRMVADLRDQGLSSALIRGGAPIGRAGHAAARQCFAELADAAGKVTERFELLTLSGWRR